MSNVDLMASTDEMTLPGDAPARPSFTVDTADKAAWALDKVLIARERLERVKRACEAAINEAELEARDAEGFFLPLLEEWYRLNPPPKGKTLRLPTGALTSRTVPGGPRVLDEAAALEWAKRHYPTAVAVKVTERVIAAEIKAYIDASGELPPGVEVTAAREKFDVKGA